MDSTHLPWCNSLSCHLSVQPYFFCTRRVDGQDSLIFCVYQENLKYISALVVLGEDWTKRNFIQLSLVDAPGLFNCYREKNFGDNRDFLPSLNFIERQNNFKQEELLLYSKLHGGRRMIAETSNQEKMFYVSDMTKIHYLGSFACNVLGDRAYLYLKNQELKADIWNAKREITSLTGTQIKGGRDGCMPLDELIQLVQTVAAPFLLASYQHDILRIFAKDFQEIQKNQFLKPRITFPSKYFTCVRREKALNQLQKCLQEKQIVVVLNDPSVSLKRVGKTEIVARYFQDYREKYAHAFWIQAFDPWYFQQDIEKMANFLQIPTEKIQEWLVDNTSYLIVFDGVEDQHVIQEYLPKSPKGHIIITSRDSLFNDDSLKIGLLTPEEGITFLCKNAKGSHEDAQRVAQSLGYVPSSLYRAVETMEAENLTLSNYESYCQTLLEKHAREAEKKSNLPSRNIDFVGRESGLVALEESFSRNKPVVLAANAGLGGIGKTQIALQYAYRTCPNYNLIWWINCGNMQISYDNLAERLGIYLTDEEKKQENAFIKRVNLYLEGKPGWLLIFDNAQDEESLKGLYPRSGGHILITSRNPIWDKTQTEVFGIEVFKREESIDLILKVIGRYDQEEEAGKLAEQLQDLPLAIAQAAAYIRETKISIQEYIEDFKKVHTALWKREEATNNYEFTVNVTWNIAMEKIQEIEKQEAIVPQPIALSLMQICSFFAPNDISREALLLAWLKIEYEASQRNINACLEDLNQTLKLLEQFSMIGVCGASISVHALVQVAVRDQLSADKQQEVYEQAFEVVARLMRELNEDVTTTWNQPKFSLLHGMALLERKELMKAVKVKTQFQLVNSLETIYRILGDFRQALKLCQNCLVIAEKWFIIFPDLNESRDANLISYNNTAVVYDCLGDYKEALRYHHKALDIKLEAFGENHPKVATSYNNVGLVYHNAGEYNKALEFYQKALEIQLQLFDENHPSVTTSYNNISGVYRNLGEYNKALVLYQKALNIDFLMLGKSHPKVAGSYNNIGSFYEDLGEYGNAVEFYRKALKIMLEVLDKHHPDVAKVYINIGSVYDKLGKSDKALKFYQKSLKVLLQALGENHKLVATNYNNIGLVYAKLGDYSKALEFYQKSLKINLLVFSENHLNVATAYNNIGGAYSKLSDYNRTIEHYQKALKIYLLVLGGNNPKVAISYSNIGSFYEDVGEYSKALEFYKKALTIELQVLDNRRPELASICNNIGSVYNRLGKSTKALKFNQKSLEILLRTFGEDHILVAASCTNTGLTYAKLGDYGKTIECYLKSLKIRLVVLGENHLDVATSCDNLGTIYNNLGKYDRALEFYLKALEVKLQIFSENHADVATSCNNIGSIYDNLMEYDKAIEFYQKALKIWLQMLDENQPYVAIGYNNIGLVYNNLEKYDKALQFHQKSLEIRLQVFGENHPEVAISYNNIGGVYFDLGNYDKTLEYYQRALAVQLQLFSENHPHVAISYNNIGAVYDNLKEYDKALEFYQKALNVNLQATGGNHLEVAENHNSIGSVYYKFGDHDRTMEHYQKALEVQLQLLGENHLDVAKSYNNIGSIYGGLKKHSKALKFHQKALEIKLHILGENYPEAATDYSNIGSIYNKLLEYNEALGFQQKALKIRLQLLGENHLDVAVSYNNIGTTYSNLGNLKKALEHCQKALKIWLEVLGENHPNVAASYNNIGAVYSSIKEDGKAIGFFQKALGIWLQAIDENHLNIITSHSNIGASYRGLGEVSMSLRYAKEALRIANLTYPSHSHEDKKRYELNIEVIKKEAHQQVDMVLNAIMKKQPLSGESYRKAFSIWLELCDEKYPILSIEFLSLDTTKILMNRG